MTQSQGELHDASVFSYDCSVEIFSGVFNDADILDELNNHRVHRAIQPPLSFREMITRKVYAHNDLLTLTQQAAVFNSISNDPTPGGKLLAHLIEMCKFMNFAQ